MPDHRRALIAGGGIAGLSAAIALRQAGYAVTVFERASAIEPIGAALSLWPNALVALRRLGAAARIEAAATPIATMRLAERDGRAIFGPHALPPGQAFMVTRTLLRSALLDALGTVDLRLGQAIGDVSQDADGVRVTLAGGGVERGDIAVIADGIWSPTATALLGNPPRYRGYAGTLALSDPVDGIDPAGITAEYQADHERFGVFDIGGGRLYWFHMRDTSNPATSPLSRRDLAERAAAWPPVVRAAIAATADDRLLPFAVHARGRPTRLGQARILVAGDAAHAMEPNLGQGGCQALEDAVALGVAAARVPPVAMLALYERLRLDRVRTVVRQSAEGRHGAHGNRLKQRLVRGLLRAVPAVVERRLLTRMHAMPDYGVPHDPYRASQASPATRPLASPPHSRDRMPN